MTAVAVVSARGVVKSGEDRARRFAVRGAACDVALRWHCRGDRRGMPGDDITVTVRPERVRVYPDGVVPVEALVEAAS
jgi:hypothetical protein